MVLDPFNLPGPQFLQLYGVLLLIAIALGLAIPAWIKPQGNERPIKDPEQLAYLAGGATRMAEAVVSGLLVRRALGVATSDSFIVEDRGAGRSPAERSVLAMARPRWGSLAGAIRPHAGDVERKLIDAGLMMSAGEATQIRFFQTIPYLLLLGFGSVKLEIGLSREKPVGFLVVLLFVTGILGLIRFLTVDRVTRGGKAMLARERTRADRLRRALPDDEAGLAVALFGTTVLAGSSYAAFHTMRTASSDGGASSGSDGGSGCGGGGGGGGCGGCGGS